MRRVLLFFYIEIKGSFIPSLVILILKEIIVEYIFKYIAYIFYAY